MFLQVISVIRKTASQKIAEVSRWIKALRAKSVVGEVNMNSSTRMKLLHGKCKSD